MKRLVLTVNSRHVDGVAIVDLSGRITLGPGLTAFNDAVQELLAAGEKKIVLNLGGVEYSDSSGLGQLVVSLKDVKGEGGQLKLLNVPKRIQDLMRMTRIANLFEMHTDESAAVASFV